MSLTLLLVVVAAALVFTYINGFHDTANSIATVVATRVLTPGQAVLLAAVTNLLGALMGTAVAMTIATGIVDTGLVDVGAELLIGALLAAIIWNLVTWWYGLPSSSSHALIGSLIGAALAASGNNLQSVIWAEGGLLTGEGVIPKVVIPMVVSPAIGFMIAFLFMGLLFSLMMWFAERKGWLRRLGRTPFANAFYGKAQLLSAAAMGISHGMNDAQKTMGIIALALVSATASGTFVGLPEWLDFLRIAGSPAGGFEVPVWIKVVAALTMAAGTAAGGWRIIHTMGHKMVKLHPINGFAAETSAATVIIVCSHFGFPVSTTHIVSASIMGVGSAKRFSAIRWTVVERMVWAWVFTLPVTAAIAYVLVRLLHGFFV